MRIYEFAKLLNKKSADIVKLINEHGFDKKHTNAIETDIKKFLKEYFKLDDSFFNQKETKSKSKSKTGKSKTKKELKKPIIVGIIKKKKPKPEPEPEPEPEMVDEIDGKEVEDEQVKDTDAVEDKLKDETSDTEPQKTDKDSEQKETSDDKTEIEKDSEQKIDKSENKKSSEPESEKAKPAKPRVQQMVFTKKKSSGGYKSSQKSGAKSKEEETLQLDAKGRKKRDISAIRKEIEGLSRKKRRKKSKLQRLLKKQKIAERLEKERIAQEERENLIQVTDPTTVADIADKINKPSAEIIQKLMEMGMMVTITQKIDADTINLIAAEYNIEIEIVDLYNDDTSGTDSDEIQEEVEDDREFKSRPPIVTVMGHVDHGKTTLLDSIRDTRVTEGEAGGITQHIGAYKIKYKDNEIVFLDTPGHEAFTAMRARGATVTDIVVLIVAADDGVMPQTIEAINHAKAAEVPIIVAINKIDKDNADVNKLKQQLSENNILIEEWGGEILATEISAINNKGIQELLDNIVLLSEMAELKSCYDCPAEGTVIECQKEKGKGTVINVLITDGVLKVGDPFIAGLYNGKVRAMFDDSGNNIKEAGPATPVSILGCSDLPAAGDPFTVYEDEKSAKQISEKRQDTKRQSDLQEAKKISLEKLFDSLESGDTKELNIILKSDVSGSMDALRSSLEKLSTERVAVKVLHEGVGGISENDVLLATASNAIIIGFNVRPEIKAKKLAETENVEIRTYDIIYNVIDDIKAAMEGMLEAEIHEVYTGQAEVLEVFKISKVGKIAGCRVIEGKIFSNCNINLLRDNKVIYKGKINSLKHYKNDAKEVKNGEECGIGIENFSDIKVGDIIEANVEKEIQPTL